MSATDWKRHELEYTHSDGQKTALYLQTNGHTYVLSEHPSNNGPAVSEVAQPLGDGLIKERLAADPLSKPEELQLYVQRQDRGADGEARFDKWEAKTTKVENVSKDPNHFDHRPSEWRWAVPMQYEHQHLQDRLHTQIPQKPQQAPDTFVQDQNREFAEMSFSNSPENQQLRQEYRHKR